MTKQDRIQKSTEILRQAARQQQLSPDQPAMELIPELMEAVEFDGELMGRRMEAELNKKTGNPFNALLGLMGLRIVSTKRAHCILSEGGHAPEDLLKLNEGKLTFAAGKLAAALAHQEQETHQAQNQNRQAQSRLHGELDKARGECDGLRSELAAQQQAVVERVQYMLSLAGPDSENDPMARQLFELLEDLGARAYWQAEDAPFTDGAMFTELKCADPALRRKKPCIANGQQVLVKGIRFVSGDGSI